MKFAPLAELTSRQRSEAALASLSKEAKLEEKRFVVQRSEKARKYIREYMRKYRANKKRLTGKDR